VGGEGGDEGGEEGRGFEIPDAVREHDVVVCGACVRFCVAGGGGVVEGYSRADGGGEDVALGVFEGGCAVVWGAWVDGVDVASWTDGVGERDCSVTLATTELEDSRAGGDGPEIEDGEAVLQLGVEAWGRGCWVGSLLKEVKGEVRSEIVGSHDE